MKIYRYKGRWWHGGFCSIGMLHPTFWGYVQEFFWMCRWGEWSYSWNRKYLIFGLGRDWYDGPIWYGQFGFFGVSIIPGKE